jgi:hypothetical protein
VGDAAAAAHAAAWSPVVSFVAPNADAAEVVLLAFGDMGNARMFLTAYLVRVLVNCIALSYFSRVAIDGSNQHSWDYDNHGEINALNTTHFLTLAASTTPPPAVVVHFGDISYAVGYQGEWDQFHEQVRPVASHVPWMVSVGTSHALVLSPL